MGALGGQAGGRAELTRAPKRPLGPHVFAGPKRYPSSPPGPQDRRDPFGGVPVSVKACGSSMGDCDRSECHKTYTVQLGVGWRQFWQQ